jgi:hypothetical protein
MNYSKEAYPSDSYSSGSAGKPDTKKKDFPDPKDWERHMPRIDGHIDFKWNHKLIKFPEAILKAVKEGKLDPSKGHKATDIIMVQLDTGYTEHPSIKGYPGYDISKSKTFVHGEKGDGKDPLIPVWPQEKGHSANTAFTVVGLGEKNDGILREEDFTPQRDYDGKERVKSPLITKNVGEGLFPYITYVPVRASKNVILSLGPGSHSVRQVYHGVQYAVEIGAHVIAMSMGWVGE